MPALGRLRQEDQCEFETSLGYKSELKGGWEIALWHKCLPGKCKVLSLNPSPEKKKKERKEITM